MLKSELQLRLDQSMMTVKEFNVKNAELKNELNINAKELERLKDAALKAAELRIDNTKLTSALHGGHEEIAGMRVQVDNMTCQMEQISQSIYTMLQVKYPENKPMDLSAGAVNEAWTPDCEEKRFLQLIHRLCTKRHFSSDLYN